MSAASLFLPTLAAALIAVVAAFSAMLAARRSSRHAANCLRLASELAQELRKTKRLESQVSELDDAWTKSLDQLKRLRSRVGMRDLRERMNAEDEGERRLQGAAWKQAMRAKLKLGPGSTAQHSMFGDSSEG